ncbi:Protein CBG17780 [Caenorhabditis briggsae]|uniref:Protein CBG17780 n=1 Tax=Caenorhabditis briggsae TaxID=6238 RepID=A8XRS6_CAEBR|nr:Protein CBG17780 [Caenorhabditis briggsae]CAP35351.2 Protein CBG17780 [Caenorhabditis briggsae]
MALKEKCSNPLMSLVIILMLLVLALITAVIVLRLDKNPRISGPPEELRNATNSPESLNPQKNKLSTLKPSDPPKIQPTNPTNSRPNIPNFKPRNVCESPECITLAQQLHNWQDPKIDPCVDFYKHSCGKYIEHTVIEGTISSKKSKIINSLIKEHLIKNEPTDSIAEKSLKMFYQKCESIKTSEDDFEENLEQTFQDLLADIKSIGSWPLLEWDESKFDLNETLINLAKLGTYENGLFTLINPGAPWMVVAPITDGGAYDLRLRDKGIKRVLEENGIPFDDETVNKDFDDFLKLYRKLREFPIENPMEVDQISIKEQVVKDQFPSIDFEKILENLVDSGNKNAMEMVKSRTVIHKTNFFFGKNESLDTIIQTTPKRVLANFLIFHFIDSSASSFKNQFNIGNCDEMATDNLPEAGFSVIVKNHFDRENIQIVSDLVEEIKDSFEEMIQESTWLHEKTKKAGIQKLQKMKKTIGYPEEFENLDEIYENLNLLPTDSFYTMQRKIDRLRGEMTMNFVALETLLDPSNNLLETNARYSMLQNYLMIMVPFMDDPLFDSTYPKYAIMAGTGSVLAHEIGHGFDEMRSGFNENGKRKNWWQKEDSEEYKRRMECLIDQYNNYDDPDFGKGRIMLKIEILQHYSNPIPIEFQNFNRTNTIGEMLADGFGMDTAWRVVRKLDMEKEPKIIGFDNDNTRKIFFRVAALSFCAPRDTEDIDYVAQREHPTDSFRVNGVFSNMKAFAETFNCPVGSPMNPKKKCELF